jgi:hypothetical protein
MINPAFALSEASGSDNISAKVFRQNAHEHFLHKVIAYLPVAAQAKKIIKQASVVALE